MLKRLDIVRILSVCVCLCHVVPASPCGGNPMRSVENFARNNGFDSSAQMLHFMRLNTPSDYSSFMQEYRRYLDCTQMVQNGYFKRSVDFSGDNEDVTSAEYSNEQQIVPDKREGDRIEQNLVSVDARPKSARASPSVRTEFKRKWEEERKRAEPSWRNNVSAQLQPLLNRTSSVLKRLLRGIHAHGGSQMATPDQMYKKSNLYTEIHSRKR